MYSAQHAHHSSDAFMQCHCTLHTHHCVHTYQAAVKTKQQLAALPKHTDVLLALRTGEISELGIFFTEFLELASPARCMALLIAAVKLCPGWQHWRYEKQVGTAVAAASTTTGAGGSAASGAGEQFAPLLCKASGSGATS
jgi:hypothetical protein